MDNAYQFGRIQVSCEGYDYPDDPYVLKGSCGVRADDECMTCSRMHCIVIYALCVCVCT